MRLKLPQLLLSVFLHVAHYCYAEDGQTCASDTLYPCPEGQKCVESTGRCGCPNGLVVSGEHCVAADAAGGGGGGHSSVAAVVIVFVVALLAVGALLIVRRYHLVEWARRRLEARRNRDVLYEDVMIGQDDPPLTP